MRTIVVLMTLLVTTACSKNVDLKKEAEQPAPHVPTTAEQIQGMGKMCADTAEARKARDAKQSLFLRLGGKDKIKKLTADFVGLHYKNTIVEPFFRNTKQAKAVDRGAKWFIANSGGPKVYHGSSLKKTHAKMNITPEAFLAAGGDVAQAMKDNGYSQEDTQDVMCLLGSHMDEVVAIKK